MSQGSPLNGGSVGGRLLQNVDLLGDEQVLWSAHADRLMPYGAEATGRLFLTTQRIVFCPLKRDLFSGPWAVDRRLVQEVWVEPRAGIVDLDHKPQVMIRADVGTLEAFLVVSAKAVARRLNKVLFADSSQS